LINNLDFVKVPHFIQIPLTLFVILGVSNAFNLIDGMNGLCSGIGTIILLSIGIIAYQNGDTELFKVALILSSSLFAFFLINLRGKIFMGDAGSYMVGFTISMLAIMLIIRNTSISPFAPVLLAIIPIFDTLFAMYRRMRLNISPFKPDKKHLHHVLLKHHKDDKKVVLIILLMQLITALITILAQKHTIMILGVFVIFVVFLVWVWKEHRKKALLIS
jgi:UDP-GlcNAc:undecaprenyl-phosphate GlcNAc-1-phosphate transferase